MTYAFSWPLQQALYAALGDQPTIAAEADGGVHDAPPHAETLGPDPAPFLLIGDETVEAWGDADAPGAAHVLTISVISGEAGFGRLKRIAGAVCDAALGPLSLSRGRVALARFLGARTRVIARAGLRRIDLRFRFAIEQDG